MAPFITLLLAFAFVFGLLIGSFLNVVAHRVPAGTSILRESRCPHCDTAIKPWHNIPVIGWILLRGRCATCRAPISMRYPIVEAFTGVAFALITWWVLVTVTTRFASGPSGLTTAEWWAAAIVLVAFFYFAAISIVLTLIDMDTRRLPNSIVLPSYLVAGFLFGLVAWLTADWASLLRAGIGMAALYAFYFVLRLVRPGGMGGGDVKLAGVIGIYLGWIGWGALTVGAFAAFVFGGVYGIALILLRRAGRKSAIPFGPWMILGAWTGVLTGESIGRWYVNLLVGT
ncbi:A24 family peptidase [Microbacterium awajiense]|uniref:Prepilin leader peptidase/N-methyltransferase n=1 Tax=Microbacterium awajiense TaxID=415214 RepID=A0ABP6ZZA7_9MICO